MRNKFDGQLAELNHMLIEMGALIEKTISLAIEALEKQNTALAKQAVAFDEEIDQKENDIEALCIKLLLRQQPVAKDLRLITAALKMITDMERIGDQAADISEITLMMAETSYAKSLGHIPQMAKAAAKMVSESIDAFVQRDLELAKAVIECDDVVDDLFMQVRHDLIGLIRADSASDEKAMDLLMVAKYLERIGDHAVNIAEWVVFSITGVHGKAGDLYRA